MDRRDFLKTAGKGGLYIASGGLAFALSGCEDIIFDPSWVTATEISPLPDFRGWWDEISSCSRLSGNFNRIMWFHVQGYFPCIIDGEQTNCDGIWRRPHDIYLSDTLFRLYNFGSGTTSYQEAKRIVKHEMLHDLLNTGKHPPIFKQCNV